MHWLGYHSLKEAFAAGTTPASTELKGYYVVRLVTGILPDIRFFSHCKFFPDDVAVNGGGYNEFLGRIRIGDFITEDAQSILGDGQQVLRINYNRPGNPFWLKGLNDELKTLRPGFYLGRGVYRLGSIAINTFYFSVERIS
ncbi:MAG: hypothetical protein ABFD81_19685 [Syntrophaceae bacterium]